MMMNDDEIDTEPLRMVIATLPNRAVITPPVQRGHSTEDMAWLALLWLALIVVLVFTSIPSGPTIPAPEHDHGRYQVESSRDLSDF